MEQLDGLLGAADVQFDDDTLDRIDAIVPPGTTVNDGDDGWVSPAVATAWRRRPPAAR